MFSLDTANHKYVTDGTDPDWKFTRENSKRAFSNYFLELNLKKVLVKIFLNLFRNSCDNRRM